MDIVFYGSSLNYDQGSGNYQELKKITKWDGRQYTLVSRYALRYSLLKTAEELGLWKNAGGDKLERAGGDKSKKAGEEGKTVKEGKTVIQPSIESLLRGEILKYPEFDFFGYLITGTTPQNFREAPVKISHATSLTPYNYDNQFAGNLWLARRMVEAGKAEKMDPNLFTIEEHQTYYIYTVVIDINRIGESEVYIAKIKLNNKEIEIAEIKKENGKICLEYLEDKKGRRENKREEIEIAENINVDLSELNKLFKLTYKYAPKDKPDKLKNLINLIKAILNLNRSIKGRNESLAPKLLIVGLYKNVPYKSYKDRIILSYEYEEIYEVNGVIRRSVKTRKPLFILKGIIQDKNNIKSIDEAESVLLNDNGDISQFLNNNNNNECEEILVFKAPEIEIKND